MFRQPGPIPELDALLEHDLPCVEPLLVGGDGPVLQVLFTEDQDITSYESMLYADKDKAFKFGCGMIKRGFFVSPYEKIYLSTALTNDDVDHAIEAMREVLMEIAKTT